MTIEHKTYIQASPDLVWSVTTDIENWPTWNPIVTVVNRLDDIPLGFGSKVQIKQPWQPTSEWEITAFEDEKRFAWETHRIGLRMRAVHILERHRGETMNILRVEVSGILSWWLYPLLKPLLCRSLSKENIGLKKHCEKYSSGWVP